MTSPNNSTISDLPAVASITGDEELPLDQTSGGNTVTRRATVLETLGGTVGSPTDTAKGDSLVLHYEGAGTARTLRDILRDTVEVRNYVTGGAGTTVSPWTGWDTAIGTWTAKRYHFTAGVYAFPTTINWAVTDILIDCDPEVTLKFTGTGVGIKFDAGATATNLYDCYLKGFPLIQGTATMTYGLWTRGVHHSVFEARVVDAATAGVLINYAVCNTYRIIVAPQHISGGYSTTPGKGIVLDRRDPTENTSWCLFERPIVEGVGGAGMDFVYANGNVVVGGTLESNQKGAYVADGCRVNSFINVAIEDNSVSDIEDFGTGTTIKNCNCISAGSTGTVELGGDGCVIEGGRAIKVNIQAGGVDTTLVSLGVGSGGIVAAEAYIQVGCYTVDSDGLRTASIVDPAFLAFNSSTDANVTGNNTVYTVICDSEVYDKNANYNNATGVFTAPRPGLYRFSGQILVDELGTGDRFVEIRLVTSNRTYFGQYSLRVDATYTVCINVLADMDAADTARLDVRANGVGADTADVFGDASGLYTFFSGKLEEPR